MSFLLAAITLGFLGSFHCIGMCGPIALALPVHHKPAVQKYGLILLYNVGRMLTYSVFGLVAGLIGKGFVIAGIQQGLSIGLGFIILLSVWLPVKRMIPGTLIFFKLKTTLSKKFSNGTRSSLLTIGLLNGLLPCGLVYMGTAGAAATGDPLKGAMFMLLVGLGTAPMMFLLPVAGNMITLPVRNSVRKATPVIVTVMAVLLVLRGLNLGIPYVSPKISETTESVHCHSSEGSKMIRCKVSQTEATTNVQQ